MRGLNDFSEAWRDYLYANGEDYAAPDPDNFITRVQLISDSHEQLLEAMLKDEPDMELVAVYKEEIAFQREQLKETIGSFADYCRYRNYESEPIDIDDILNGLCSNGTNYFMYEVAVDWNNWGERAQRIWERLNDSYGCGLIHIQNDLCKLILKEVYDSKRQGE